MHDRARSVMVPAARRDSVGTNARSVEFNSGYFDSRRLVSCYWNVSLYAGERRGLSEKLDERIEI